ncbi:MAG TPA: LysM domain-containing protein [Burkholderiales bacterium]
MADDVQLRPDRPERYTVVRGDTLWDIAARFLQSPWHWPRVWKINEAIKNPHLIYPGDVIVLRYVDGAPALTLLRSEKLSPGDATDAVAAPSTGRTAKLLPRVHSEPLEQAIPTIPPDAIAPFLTEPRVVEEDELEEAGYVTVGLDNRIALGTRSEFYARGIDDTGAEYFQIFRPGQALKHPETGELLAYEALYLGDAQLLAKGDPAKLVVTSSKQEILPADRLLAAPRNAVLPYYFPHAPGKTVRGYIIAALNAVAEIGTHTVVTISLGARDGIEEGHVLRVMYRQGQHRDPVTGGRYELPEEEAGLLLVFRTFDKVAYGIILNATRPINLLDSVVTP